MTPRDFMLALIEAPSQIAGGEEPKELTDDDVKKVLRHVPNIRSNSPHFFRQLGEEGLISFPEFVFLLCALTSELLFIFSLSTPTM